MTKKCKFCKKNAFRTWVEKEYHENCIDQVNGIPIIDDNTQALINGTLVFNIRNNDE